MSKSSEIKTWQEREQYATDDGTIMNAMQQEINDLRAALRTYEGIMPKASIDAPDPEPSITIEIPDSVSNTIIFRYFSDTIRELPRGEYNLYLHPQQ